jgi:hypothetical protein
MVFDLQGGDRLSEEKGDGSQVGVAKGPQAVAQLLKFLRRELGVLHVPQVRLIVNVPPVHLGEEVGRELK